MIFRKKITAVLLAAVVMCALALSGCADKISYTFPDKVSVYVTTGTKASLMGRKSSLTLVDFGEEDYRRQTVYVDTSRAYQSFTGYGASLTHSSAYLLMQADEQTRKNVLEDLFSRDGANFSVVRIPVGASDYIPDDEYFTCDDNGGNPDKELKHFTLEHDAEIIALCKQIKEINPQVKFIASPWSAPAWMKDNESLVGAGSLKADMYETFADYLVKFVTEYAKEGVDITMLTIENEPGVGALSYPTMNLNAIEAARVTQLTGERLAAAKLNVDIVSWDFNYGSGSSAFADTFIDTLYDDEAKTAGKYSSTVGFHCYDGDGYYNADTMNGLRNGIEKVTREYGKATLITEITESAAGTDFASNLTYACKNVVIKPCAVQTDEEDNAWNGCGGALYWNFVLDGKGMPTPAYHGNECYGVITLDSVTRQGKTEYKYKKSSAYYAMAHVSKFLYDVDGMPCRALKATTEYVDLSIMAYYRNDGAAVVVICNTNENNEAAIDMVLDNKKKVSFDMAPQSVVTFVC